QALHKRSRPRHWMRARSFSRYCGSASGPRCGACCTAERERTFRRMSHLALEPQIVDAASRRNAVERLRQLNVTLPTFSELANPERIPARHLAALAGI